MRKIVISYDVHERINLYATNYRKYYSDFYRDGGIWSEDKIIENYITESLHRQDEIYERIMTRLGTDPILGKTSETTITIPWRSHYLTICWEDDGELRKIIHIDIQ